MIGVANAHWFPPNPRNSQEGLGSGGGDTAIIGKAGGALSDGTSGISPFFVPILNLVPEMILPGHSTVPGKQP